MSIIQFCHGGETTETTGISTLQYFIFIGDADLFQRKKGVFLVEEPTPANCQQKFHQLTDIAIDQHNVKKLTNNWPHFGLFGKECEFENLW